MPKYVLTNEEIAALKAIIHLGVKAGGMDVAEAAVVISKKLNNPMMEKPSGQNPDTSRPEENSSGDENTKPKA